MKSEGGKRKGTRGMDEQKGNEDKKRVESKKAVKMDVTGMKGKRNE